MENKESVLEMEEKQTFHLVARQVGYYKLIVDSATFGGAVFSACEMKKEAWNQFYSHWELLAIDTLDIEPLDNTEN